MFTEQPSIAASHRRCRRRPGRIRSKHCIDHSIMRCTARTSAWRIAVSSSTTSRQMMAFVDVGRIVVEVEAEEGLPASAPLPAAAAQRWTWRDSVRRSGRRRRAQPICLHAGPRSAEDLLRLDAPCQFVALIRLASNRKTFATDSFLRCSASEPSKKEHPQIARGNSHPNSSRSGSSGHQHRPAAGRTSPTYASGQPLAGRRSSGSRSRCRTISVPDRRSDR